MSGANQCLYIQGQANVEVTSPTVRLGDLVQMECGKSYVIQNLKPKKVLKFESQAGKKKKSGRKVVSILKIIECIHEKYPELQVENLGPTDIIVTYGEEKNKKTWITYAEIIAVMIISFAGGAFSIMTFNNDVNTTKLFDQIYSLVMGKKSGGFTVLEITYSLGIAIGILVFFNHFGKKRFSVDPTPMEVEMRLYENDIQTTIVENYSRKGEEVDVSSGNTVGNSRT